MTPGEAFYPSPAPSSRMATDLELARRQAMLQDAQRVVDHQVTAIEQLDNKTSHALTVAVSGFTLLVLLAALTPRATVAFLLLLVAAGAVNDSPCSGCFARTTPWAPTAT